MISYDNPGCHFPNGCLRTGTFHESEIEGIKAKNPEITSGPKEPRPKEISQNHFPYKRQDYHIDYDCHRSAEKAGISKFLRITGQRSGKRGLDITSMNLGEIINARRTVITNFLNSAASELDPFTILPILVLLNFPRRKPEIHNETGQVNTKLALQASFLCIRSFRSRLVIWQRDLPSGKIILSM